MLDTAIIVSTIAINPCINVFLQPIYYQKHRGPVVLINSSNACKYYSVFINVQAYNGKQTSAHHSPFTNYYIYTQYQEVCKKPVD